VFASRLLVLLTALSLLAAPGSAHEWYPRECCGGLDCAEASEIKITPDGVLATVPGLGRTILLPKGFKYRPSPDDAVHVCVDNDADTPTPRIKCIFWPRDRSFPAVSMKIDVTRWTPMGSARRVPAVVAALKIRLTRVSGADPRVVGARWRRPSAGDRRGPRGELLAGLVISDAVHLGGAGSEAIDLLGVHGRRSPGRHVPAPP